MNAQSAKVVEVADNSVVLSVNESKVHWPKDDLKGAKVGDEVFLVVMSSKDLDEHKNDLAKSILNNVMNPKDD